MGKILQTDSKKIAIYLTNKCNLRCKHCFIEGNPVNDQFLNWSQIQTALKHFIKKGFGRVEFTGGESCLSPYLLPATKMAKELGYTVGVNSNGININLPDLLNQNQIDKLTFSLDGGSPETHDFLRGKGVFNKCIETIRKSVSLGYNVEAIFTVHKLNQHEIIPAVKLLDQLGVSRLSFNFISNQGTATLNQDLLLPPESWIEARKTIEEISTSVKMSIRYPIMFVTPDEFTEIKKNTNYFCRILDPVKTEIYPNGNIYHCCLVTDFNNLSAGKVTNTRVIMKTDKERTFVEKYKHLSCPVHAIRKLYASNSKLIPFCLYYKTITPQKN